LYSLERIRAETQDGYRQIVQSLEDARRGQDARDAAIAAQANGLADSIAAMEQSLAEQEQAIAARLTFIARDAEGMVAQAHEAGVTNLRAIRSSALVAQRLLDHQIELWRLGDNAYLAELTTLIARAREEVVTQQQFETFVDNLALQAKAKEKEELDTIKAKDAEQREAKWKENVTHVTWKLFQAALGANSEVLDVIQRTLDVIGTADVLAAVPVVGPIFAAISVAADLLNAAIHLVRGNYLAAGLSALAAVPYAGLAVNLAKGAKASRAARNALRIPSHVDETVDATRALNRSRRTVGGTEDVIKKAEAPPTHSADPRYISKTQGARTLTPVRDPAPPVYKRGHPGKPVQDHVKARAAGGHPTDPANLHTKPWEWNARKGAYEGQLLKEKQRLVKEGLTPEQADAVLADEWHWVQTDVLGRPMDPELLNTIPAP